jgi:hypothetical protein
MYRIGLYVQLLFKVSRVAPLVVVVHETVQRLPLLMLVLWLVLVVSWLLVVFGGC